MTRKGYELAYHFLNVDMTAGHGNEPPWERGEERHFAGKLAMCERGYHSSPTWLHALPYAPGPVACIVEIGGAIKRDTDKAVSQKRKLLRYRNVERELRLFACDCAERALRHERKRGREPDKRSWEAVRVARRFADGLATSEELAAARDAAYAARDATRDATRDAAYAAYAAYAARDAAYAAIAAEIKWQRARLDKYMAAAFARRAR